MDFIELVGSSVEVTATVEAIVMSKQANRELVLLYDVYVNGSYFRDHTFIKKTKRLSALNTGDKFGGKATLIDYHCSSSGKLDKLGLKSFRSVYIIEAAKK